MNFEPDREKQDRSAPTQGCPARSSQYERERTEQKCFQMDRVPEEPVRLSTVEQGQTPCLGVCDDLDDCDERVAAARRRAVLRRATGGHSGQVRPDRERTGRPEPQQPTRAPQVETEYPYD